MSTFEEIAAHYLFGAAMDESETRAADAVAAIVDDFYSQSDDEFLHGLTTILVAQRLLTEPVKEFCEGDPTKWEEIRDRVPNKLVTGVLLSHSDPFVVVDRLDALHGALLEGVLDAA